MLQQLSCLLFQLSLRQQVSQMRLVVLNMLRTYQWRGINRYTKIELIYLFISFNHSIHEFQLILYYFISVYHVQAQWWAIQHNALTIVQVVRFKLAPTNVKIVQMSVHHLALVLRRKNVTQSVYNSFWFSIFWLLRLSFGLHLLCLEFILTKEVSKWCPPKSNRYLRLITTFLRLRVRCYNLRPSRIKDLIP